YIVTFDRAKSDAKALWQKPAMHRGTTAFHLEHILPAFQGMKRKSGSLSAKFMSERPGGARGGLLPVPELQNFRFSLIIL
ncbi:MAG TPA: hypothetical protein PKV71_19135, partial [Calditrichia bacterium]|nr:hypothetical protein [Calditrichia bacterium]